MLGLTVVILAVFLVANLAPRNMQPKKAQATEKLELASSVSLPELHRVVKPTRSVDPPAVISEGTPNWQTADLRVKLNKPAGYGKFLQDINGVTPEMVSNLAQLERAGYKLKTTIPVGTRLLNTGMTDSGQFLVYDDSSLNRDREALTTTNGTAVILTSCGNPIRMQVQPGCGPPNPAVNQPVQDNDVYTGGTPGYVPGSAETAHLGEELILTDVVEDVIGGHGPSGSIENNGQVEKKEPTFNPAQKTDTVATGQDSSGSPVDLTSK